MTRVRGRPRHGSARKESRAISLDEDAIERLERLGKGCLSAGVAIVEHATRGLALAGYCVPKLVRSVRERQSWIVFELVDGAPDPEPVMAEGMQMDAWRA